MVEYGEFVLYNYSEKVKNISNIILSFELKLLY